MGLQAPLTFCKGWIQLPYKACRPSTRINTVQRQRVCELLLRPGHGTISALNSPLIMGPWKPEASNSVKGSLQPPISRKSCPSLACRRGCIERRGWHGDCTVSHPRARPWDKTGRRWDMDQSGHLLCFSETAGNVSVCQLPSIPGLHLPRYSLLKRKPDSDTWSWKTDDAESVMKHKEVLNESPQRAGLLIRASLGVCWWLQCAVNVTWKVLFSALNS